MSVSTALSIGIGLFGIVFCTYTVGWVRGARNEREYWARLGRAPLPKQPRPKWWKRKVP